MDSNTAFLYALVAGILPALLWLWFWLKEDNLHPEPRLLILLSFLGGMLSVALVLPLQKWTLNLLDGSTLSYVTELKYTIWAGIEEIIKFAVVYVIALRSRFLDEPVDAMIYLITAALGFAAMENTFFILKPLEAGNMIQAFISGNLRFMGATLLHVVASATIGFAISLTFYKPRWLKSLNLFFGVILATALHTAFNLFIIESSGIDTFKVFASVWVSVIFLMLFFEKARAIDAPVPKVA
ncbi:PrsW family intramembrane metalloprotease [Patescibacteria group bacterium]|nr:MAG: PrsW family intramembrane metalloprotease [Patescibacteria group bacterium]